MKKKIKLEETQKKYETGIKNYNEFLSNTNSSLIDKITISQIINSKNNKKTKEKIFELIKNFSFRRMKNSHVYEKGVLIFPNVHVFIQELNTSNIKYIARTQSYYDVMEFTLSNDENCVVTITKTRARKHFKRKISLWFWKLEQRKKMKQILKYLIIYKEEKFVKKKDIVSHKKTKSIISNNNNNL